MDLRPVLPVYRMVIGMSGEAVGNGKCSQKGECIQEGYNEHMMLAGEHVEGGGRKKPRQTREGLSEYRTVSATLNRTSQR